MAAGVDPRPSAWRDAGLDASEAALWHEMGYNIDTCEGREGEGLGTDRSLRSSPGAEPSGATCGLSSLDQPDTNRHGAAHRLGCGTRRSRSSSHARLPPETMGRRRGHDGQHRESKLPTRTRGTPSASPQSKLGVWPSRVAGRGMSSGSGGQPGSHSTKWPIGSVQGSVHGSGEATIPGDHRGTSGALRALRQQEPAPKQDPSVLRQLITPQGPPGSSVPGPPPDDEAAARRCR